MSAAPHATLRLCACALLALTACSGESSRDTSEAPPPPGQGPNVLVLMSDDQSADMLGCAGHPWVQTPNLDRLAAGGVRFTEAFVTTSVCSPARASFLTGLWVRAHGVHDNLTPLSPDVPNVAAQFTAAGWDTAYFGKWHMGSQLERPGFTHAWSYLDQGAYHANEFHKDGTRLGRLAKGFVDDATTKFAISWIRQERDRPFFAWVGFKAAHGPRNPMADLGALYADIYPALPANLEALPPYPRPSEFEALAAEAGLEPRDFTPADDWATGVEREIKRVGAFTGESMRKYARLVTGLDRNVGQLLAALEQHGLADDTIVVFVSDNGYLHGNHGSTGKRASYDESLRVPFIVHVPGRTAAGSVRDELVLNVDLAPTLLDLAGLEIPDAMQGRSLKPLLEAAPGEALPWRTEFASEYYRHEFWAESHFAIPTQFALRGRDFKYVTYPGHPGWEQVFDLERDPLEMRNLAGEPGAGLDPSALADRLAELERALGPRLDPTR